MDQTFNVNHPVLFVLAAVCILVVVLQSVVFLVKAWRRAKELGYSEEKLKKMAITAALFTIAPAIAIGIGIITLAGTLGLPLPWLRLSVVGAIVYELSAADAAASSLGITLGGTLDAQQFATIAWTMTVGIAIGMFLIPTFCKKTVSSVQNVGKKDKAWGEHFMNAIFFGLIATFVGQALSGVTVDAAGRVTALVLLVSAITMAICGLLKSKLHWEWLNNYALPICMIVSMASAIPISQWVK